MGTRYLYLARHGMADALGQLTDVGRQQAGLLGQRLASVGVDAVWSSPLPRAVASAHELARQLPGGVPVAEAPELVDHVPHVPTSEEMPPSWLGFFDGYDEREAASGRRLADALVARFAQPVGTVAGGRPAKATVHEVLVTHAYPIAWLVREALGAPEAGWLGLTGCANTALTVIEYGQGRPPTLVMFNDMSHLPPDLRWSGFPPGVRP